MTLFWHNHFATAYSKVAGALGAEEGARYMAAKPTEDPNQVLGQIELFRKYALGNFRDLLIAVAKDTAMLVWLDGRTNVKGRPQENFARELMELFTMGVDTFAETDVYAGTPTTRLATWPGNTTPPPRSSPSRSTPTEARSSRRVHRMRGCRTESI
jgi:uncharacterized protein (DUF1800 family)